MCQEQKHIAKKIYSVLRKRSAYMKRILLYQEKFMSDGDAIVDKEIGVYL